jgi:hypothetical protein
MGNFRDWQEFSTHPAVLHVKLGRFGAAWVSLNALLLEVRNAPYSRWS